MRRSTVSPLLRSTISFFDKFQKKCTSHGYAVLDMVKTFESVNGVKVPYEITTAAPAKSEEVLGWKAERCRF